MKLGTISKYICTYLEGGYCQKHKGTHDLEGEYSPKHKGTHDHI